MAIIIFIASALVIAFVGTKMAGFADQQHTTQDWEKRWQVLISFGQ